MQSVKKVVKGLGGRFFKSFILPLRYPNGMRIILMYHRVFNERPSFPYDPAMYVTAKTLEMHIRNLLDFFDIVSLDSILDNNNRDKRLCAITFDDGWVDNYEYAFPVLKKYNVPATIFVPVGIIGTRKRFWFQEIWEIVLKASRNSLEGEFIQYFSNQLPSWKPLSVGVDEVCSLISGLKERPAEDLDSLVKEAYGRLGIDEDTSADILNWDQVKEMGDHCITFGPHGLNHYILPGLSTDNKKMEIMDSYRILKDMDVPVAPFFCYPNGDWDSETIRLVKQGGYRAGVTTTLGYNTEETNPFLLNRIGLHEDISCSPSLLWFRLFQAHTAGGFSPLP